MPTSPSDRSTPSSPRGGLRHAGLLSVCMALMGLTCSAEANPPAPEETAQTPIAAAEPRAAEADAAVSLPSEGAYEVRRAAWTEGVSAAIARADRAASAASPDDAALYLWAAAHLDPDAASSLERLERVAEGATPLAPWARLEAAQRALDGDPARARALLSPLLSAESALDDRWPGLAEARAIDALARARTSPNEERPAILAALREATASTLSSSLSRAVSRALADELARGDDAAERREATGLYQDLLAAAPRAAASADAEVALERVVATFPEDEREALRTPSLAQARAHASHLESTQQHRLASDAHLAIAARLEPGSRERCAALLDAGRALHRGRVNASAIERLDRMIGECAPALERAALAHVEGEPALAARRDALAWAHYALGRAAFSAGETPRAILHLEAIGEVAPGHRLADDGLVYAARARRERGERDRFRDALSRAIDLGGDLRGEARFLLAWDLRAEARRDEAVAELERSIAEGTNETAEGIIGRAAYWRAHLLGELGRPSEAADAYEALIRARPLTYYAQLGMARLGEIDPARRDRVRAEVLALRAPLGSDNDGAAQLLTRSEATRSIAARLVDDESRAAYARALALLAVDEGPRAERELALLGLSSDGDVAGVRTLVVLLAQSGHAHRATDLARRRLGSALVAPSDADALATYRTAYPAAFAGLIEDAAGREGVDPSLVRAIAREESSFDVDAVSVAHAYGLLQLIRPTAQRHARPLGLASDPAALCTPQVNVRIGARYMGSLVRRYDGEAALVPAAYNAGEGNVDRWLRERADLPFDEWVEEIPFGETRGYTRRVLQSWIVYAFLDRGELPALPRTVPRRT